MYKIIPYRYQDHENKKFLIKFQSKQHEYYKFEKVINQVLKPLYMFSLQMRGWPDINKPYFVLL